MIWRFDAATLQWRWNAGSTPAPLGEAEGEVIKTELAPYSQLGAESAGLRSVKSKPGTQPRLGEIAGFDDLTHHSGTLRVDLLAATVRIQRDDGYEATYNLNTGQLLKRHHSNI